MASLSDSYTDPINTYMHKINRMLDKVNMIGSEVTHAGESDAKYLRYLGLTEKAFAKFKKDPDTFGIDKAVPGKFMFYLDKDIPNGSYTLVQCLSRCNPANECYILHVRIKNCKIDREKLDELRLTDLIWNENGHSLQGEKDYTIRTFGPNDLTAGSIVEHESKEYPKRLLVFKKYDEPHLRFTEYTTEVQTIKIHQDTCHFLKTGNRGSRARAEMSPPIRFVDDGMYDESEKQAYQACLCTFLAMYQREVSTGDTQLSIKRYFNNAPDAAMKRMKWKVYAGRIDGDRFTEKETVRWIEDRYQPSRLTIQPKISGGLQQYKGNHTCIFINIFIILHHWARHDAKKGNGADTLLWKSDQTYSPYDSFYKKTFDTADQTLLRTYDFTITQCLRNWVYGILDVLKKKRGEDDDDGGLMNPESSEDRKTYLRLMLRQTLTAGIKELNIMLTGEQDRTRFPGLEYVPETFATPIMAANDETLRTNEQADLTTRAGIIIQQAFAAAFPSFTAVSIAGVVDIDVFVQHIMDLYTRPQIRQLLNLQQIATSSLAGNYYTNDSDTYDVLETLRKHPILFPTELKKGDVLLIYDSEGVSIAYFHAFRWIGKKDSLLMELEHYKGSRAEERQRDDEFMREFTEYVEQSRNRPFEYPPQVNPTALQYHLRFQEFKQKEKTESYRQKAFQYWIPIIEYTLVKGRPPSHNDMFVRDIFNVYIVSR
jgi:hypothetical protein